MFSLFFVVFLLPHVFVLVGSENTVYCVHEKKTPTNGCRQSDMVLVENCQRFLDNCVRRNTAEVPKIQVTQHLRLVKHTPQERSVKG